MPIINRPGAVLNYELSGGITDKLVTLVNGHTRSSSDFRMMSRVLLEVGISSILIDNRGSGKTETSATFSIDDMCADVIAIWDDLGVKKSSLLGISMGGFISQGVAIYWPDRVQNLILVSTASEDKYINPTGGSWIIEGNDLEQKMLSYFAPGFVDRNPLMFKNMMTQIRQAIASGVFTQRSEMQKNALKGAEWTSKLKNIAARTLIIHGSKDLVIDVCAAEILLQNIPNSKISVIEGAGHLLLAEAPKTLYQQAVEFLLSPS
jgi:pimeloyl-ACP methyl ester carboxylesterase